MKLITPVVGSRHKGALNPRPHTNACVACLHSCARAEHPQREYAGDICSASPKTQHCADICATCMLSCTASTAAERTKCVSNAGGRSSGCPLRHSSLLDAYPRLHRRCLAPSLRSVEISAASRCVLVVYLLVCTWTFVPGRKGDGIQDIYSFI